MTNQVGLPAYGSFNYELAGLPSRRFGAVDFYVGRDGRCAGVMCHRSGRSGWGAGGEEAQGCRAAPELWWHCRGGEAFAIGGRFIARENIGAYRKMTRAISAVVM